MIYTRCTSTQLQIQSKLCSPVIAKQSPTASAGFTLLELLVVITLLAVLASAALLGYEGIQDQGRYDVARFEMAEIRKALLKFRRDSGANAFPTQGQYDCTDDFNGGNSTVQNSLMTFPSEAGVNDAEIIAWCQHPTNFWMLFQDPFGSGWNIDTRRGWNGPYLQRKTGYVDVSENINPNGTGSLNIGAVIANLWGVASPFNTTPIGANAYYSWRPATSEPDYEKFGTPYFLFDLDTSVARITSLNADHDYNGDDDCEQNVGSDGFPLDSILCLLK